MKIKPIATLAAALMLTASWAGAQDLRIGLAEDPDILDPDQSRTFVGRIVYASLCDKLVDITPELEIIPDACDRMVRGQRMACPSTMTRARGCRLSTTAPRSTREAVADNITRSQTMDGSMRKSEAGLDTGSVVVTRLTIDVDAGPYRARRHR